MEVSLGAVRARVRHFSPMSSPTCSEGHSYYIKCDIQYQVKRFKWTGYTGLTRLPYLHLDDSGLSQSLPRCQWLSYGFVRCPGCASGWSRAWILSPGWHWSLESLSSLKQRYPAQGQDWQRCDWRNQAGGGCLGGSRRPPQRGTVPNRQDICGYSKNINEAQINSSVPHSWKSAVQIFFLKQSSVFTCVCGWHAVFQYVWGVRPRLGRSRGSGCIASQLGQTAGGVWSGRVSLARRSGWTSPRNNHTYTGPAPSNPLLLLPFSLRPSRSSAQGALCSCDEPARVRK